VVDFVALVRSCPVQSFRGYSGEAARGQRSAAGPCIFAGLGCPQHDRLERGHRGRGASRAWPPGRISSSSKRIIVLPIRAWCRPRLLTPIRAVSVSTSNRFGSPTSQLPWAPVRSRHRSPLRKTVRSMRAQTPPRGRQHGGQSE